MKVLLKLAKKVKGKHKVAAACLSKKGRILSLGTNSYVKTHPRQAELCNLVGLAKKHFLHAEIAAIVKAREVPYKIVVIRVNNKGELRMAKPCLICQEAIKQAGIKLMEYST